MNTSTLIPLDGYEVIISDENTKPGDTWLNPKTNTVSNAGGFIPVWSEFKKVIAQSKSIREGLPIFILDERVDEMAYNF